MRPVDTCLGIWSTVEAEKMFFEPRACTTGRSQNRPPSVWTFGLPRYTPTELRSVLGDDGVEPAVDLGERFVPRRFDVAFAAADQRCAQSVRVFVELLERRALRTDESM